MCQWLDEIKVAPLLCAANQLRRKDPARWGPRFTKKKDAIRCLLDERDSLGEILADTFKAHDFKKRTEWQRHLLRHHGSWNHPDRGGCLDELRDCEDASEIAGFAEMEPPQLINVLRERTRLRMLGSNVHYKHLDDLQGTSSLAVLRSSLELRDAGEKLRNCALSYASQVESRTCVLVVLRVASGKPTALGQFDMATAKWVSIRETCNRMPTAATRTAFNSYTATIQARKARTIA
ncbi:hypothetical protein M885DRAFT_567734 [Pelagophyceae sp. CCMP2097]|nr:hypothetical protein M885DRAFT_567734 [Pelagophyceae sp. CCMP2097]